MPEALTTAAKDSLTTGDVARICRVAPRTATKWIDTEMLPGFRIPGSKDRRVLRSHLAQFMAKQGMPPAWLATGAVKVLIVSEDRDGSAVLTSVLREDVGLDVQWADRPYAAGLIVGRWGPDVVLIDANGTGDVAFAFEVGRTPETASMRVIVAALLTLPQLAAQGIAYLPKPYTARDVARAITAAVEAANMGSN